MLKEVLGISGSRCEVVGVKRVLPSFETEIVREVEETRAILSDATASSARDRIVYRLLSQTGTSDPRISRGWCLSA
jgi:hypothetical protein